MKNVMVPKLLLFDLSIRGHHPAYIRHLITYWREWHLACHLDIVVSARFPHEHPDVMAEASHSQSHLLNIIPIAPEEEATLHARTSRLQRMQRHFQEWHLFQTYTKALAPSHCLLMFIDTYQLPLLLRASAPRPFSGIYFRPSFHYRDLQPYTASVIDCLRQWCEKRTVARISKHPQLRHLFCLDPFAVEPLSRLCRHVRPIALPDPVQPTQLAMRPCDLRQKLDIEPERIVFLLFGSLTARKGVYPLLDAIATLSPQLCQKFCLLLVGESNIEFDLESRIKQLSQSRPVQIIRRYEFIPEPEIQPYFQLADVVLAPYQRHVGMSGILILAAAAGTPVLSSNYGLMGAMVRHHQLGLTVDSGSIQEIATGLRCCLTQAPTTLCNRQRMQAFAQQNRAERFAKVIYNALLDQP
jgi:glycosyltransferase involved in cell wall biosynthesis